MREGREGGRGRRGESVPLVQIIMIAKLASFCLRGLVCSRSRKTGINPSSRASSALFPVVIINNYLHKINIIQLNKTSSLPPLSPPTPPLFIPWAVALARAIMALSE